MKNSIALFSLFCLFSLSLFAKANPEEPDSPREGALDALETVLEDPLVQDLLPGMREKLELETLSPFSGAPPEGQWDRDRLWESALAANSELRTLMMEKNQAVIGRRGAVAMYFPTVDFEADFSFIANPLEPISLTAGELGAYQTPEGAVNLPMHDVKIYDGMESTMYNFKFILEQPLFTWGKITNAVLLYEKVSEATDLKFRRKVRELKTELVIRMMALERFNRIEEDLLSQKESARRLEELSRQAYENGFVVYADYMDVKVRASEVELGLHQIREQRRQTLLRISQISGVPDLRADYLNLSSWSDEILSPVSESVDVLYNRALAENGDVRLLSLLSEISEYKQKISESSTYLRPDLGLRLEFSYGGPRFPLIETDWYGKDRYNLIFSLGFKTRILDGGQRLTAILNDEQEVLKSLEQSAQGLRTIREFIETRKASMDLQRHRIQFYRLKQDQDQVQIDRRRAQWDSGSGSEAEFLKAQLILYSDRITMYKEMITYGTDYYQLQAVVEGEF